MVRNKELLPRAYILPFSEKSYLSYTKLYGHEYLNKRRRAVAKWNERNTES